MAEFRSYQYRVFLTASADEAPSRKWLKAALETFPIDQDLVGRRTEAGLVPRSLRPVICDDAATPGDTGMLSEATVASLQAAQFLVVLCSPASVLSPRIDEEIRHFNAMHRGNQVVPVIVGGSPGDPHDDCFPQSLQFKLSCDRQPTDARGEPIADARATGDGAVQKVVARLIGLPPDEMAERTERGRRRQRNIRRTGVAAVLALLVAYEGGMALARHEFARNDALLDHALRGVVRLGDAALAASQRLDLPPDLSTGILEHTEQAGRNLLALGGATPHTQYRKAALLLGLARRYSSLGDDKVQKARVSEAERVLRALVNEVPGNPAWSRDLAARYDELGDLLRAQGRPKDALAAYRMSAALAERAAEPGNAAWRRELAASHIKAGDAAVAQGALDEALESYQRSFAIEARLAAADRSDIRSQYGVLLAREKIGDVLRVQGEHDQALASYAAARAIADDLILTEPRNLAWRRALLLSWIKTGDVLALAGRDEEALASYRISNAMAERVSAAEPSLAEWHNHLAISHDRIGSVLHARGDLVEALRQYRTSVAIAGRAVIADPRNGAWQRDLGIAHEHAGEALQALGNLAEALTEFEARRTIIAHLAEIEPANPGWQYDLGSSHARIGFVLEARGNFAAAALEYEACLEIGRRFAAADPGNARWQRDLAVSYQRLANAHHRLGKVTQALAELRRGRDIMAALVQVLPEPFPDSLPGGAPERLPEMAPEGVPGLVPDRLRWTADLARLDTRIAALQGRPSMAPAPPTCDGPCPVDPAGRSPVVVAGDLRSRIETLPAAGSKLDN